MTSADRAHGPAPDPTTGPRASTSLRRRSAAACLALAALALLAEGGLRLRAHLAWPADLRASLSEPGPGHPGGRTRLADVLRTSDAPRVLFELRPNLNAQYKGALLATDERGLIRTAATTETDPTAFRVLSIGGSFLMPQGCPPGTDCVSRLLERLRAQQPARPFSLDNASAPLQRLAMKVAWLEAHAAQLDPDLVLVGFGAGDLDLPSYLPAPPAPLDLGRSFLWDRLTRTRPTLSFVDRGQLAWHGDHATPPPRLPPSVRPHFGHAAGRAALDRLKHLSDNHDWELALVTNLEVGEAPWIIEQARARGLHVFSGDRSLRAALGLTPDQALPPQTYLRSNLVLSPAVPHPSTHQHDLLAAALESDLRTHGLITRLLDRPRHARTTPSPR